MEKLSEKIKEALSSTLPITCIVLAISIFIVPVPIGTLMMFLAGALLLIIGMGFFSLGADMAMMPLGEGIGIEITKSKSKRFALAACLIIGIIITVAEPDLQVLATQVAAIPDSVLIITVAIGVGIFLAFALLRIIFKLPLSKMLFFFYALVFILAYFAPDEFMAVAFDSGGVTTGPITVPFIMALGIGFSMLRGDRNSQSDSFGLVAICSIGPIISVLLLGIIFDLDSATYTQISIPDIATSGDMASLFAHGMPEYAKEVLKALIPISIMFMIFQGLTRRFKGKPFRRVIIGLFYTYVGLVTFLTGVNIGFMPAGYLIGRGLASSRFYILLIPIGALMGKYIVSAEPAVHVLTKQVEELSGGAISEKSMLRSLSFGVALSLALSLSRIIFDIPVMYFLVPGYALALALTLITPKIYTAIAFDSGGVASGPMTATFLLPFAMGACDGLGGNILTQAFGIVAMVAMTPLLTIQIMGCLFTKKVSVKKLAASLEAETLAMAVMYYEED